MTTSYGPVRQVMFAPTSNVADVNSFLIRDDAYARSSAVLGRTLRLGDPIDTGVVSASYQTSWSGGRDQTLYSDTSMYLDSTLDTTDLSGRVKLWQGFAVDGFGGTEFTTSIINSPVGTNYASNAYLFANNNGLIWSKLIDTPYTQSNIATFSPDVPTVMSPLDQTYAIGSGSATWVAIGFSNGNYKILNTTSGTIEDRSHPTVSERANILDMTPFNKKMAIMMAGTLWTCDLTGPGSLVWNKVQAFSQADGLNASLAVLNGVLYILISYRGGTCALYSSDGVSGATLIYKFENAYPVKLHALKGGLYIHVNEYAFTRTSTVLAKKNGALYSYGGGIIKKLYSREDASKYFVTAVSDGPSCIWGDYIAMSYYSLPKTFNSSTEDRTIGVLLYNPTNDSFHMGPSLSGFPSATRVSAMGESNESLYMSVTDGVNNIMMFTRRDGSSKKGLWSSTTIPISIGVRGTEQKFKLISSTFDANFPDLQKTWLRVNVKHNLERTADAFSVPTMNVYVRTSSNDYDSTEYLIGTYSPSIGQTGWRTSSFDIAWTGTKYPKSNQLRYVIELKYPHNSSDASYGEVFVDKAIIDSVSVEYMLVATPRKVWRARVLCEDDQLKINGAVNVLDTRQELVDKLFQYWEDGQPLYYWDASPANVTPSSVNYDHIVMITDIGENSYRVDDRGEEVNSEVSLTMYEVA